MKLDLHRDDEVGYVNGKGEREHGIVHEVLPWAAWVSLDKVFIDVLIALDDRRLSKWQVS